MSIALHTFQHHWAAPINLSLERTATLLRGTRRHPLAPQGAVLEALMICLAQDSPRVAEPLLETILSDITLWERASRNWMTDLTSTYTFVRPRFYDLQVLYALGRATFRRQLGDRFKPDQLTWTCFPPSYAMRGALLAQWRLVSFASSSDSWPLELPPSGRAITLVSVQEPSPIHWSGLAEQVWQAEASYRKEMAP
jgi:hypothetical protein